jgi:hypothetical protein
VIVIANTAGLFSDILDIDKFIKINNLKQCTDPIFISKNSFTVNGVLSYEIFGTSVEERRSRMAYIDLNGHYMHPLAAKKLKAYDRKLNDILMALGRYKLSADGELIKDDENGETGPEFLYKIWGKVKVKDKNTVTTKEIQKFYERPKEKLFITKWLVIPAFFRDINTSTMSFSKSTNTLNNWYSSIISYTQTMAMYTEMFGHMTALTQARVQNLLIEIYKHLMEDTIKGNPSKFGMLRRYFQARNVNYSARLVISASNQRKDSYTSVQVKLGEGLVPLAAAISCFYPFVVYEMKRYFDMEFIQSGQLPVLTDSGKIEYITFSDTFDEKHITDMITRYLNSPSTRFDLVETPPDKNGRIGKMTITGRFGKSDTTITRPATVTDILYITTMRAVKNKHIIVTRYPLDNFNGQFPAKIAIASTIKTTPATIGTDIFQFYPICEGDPNNAFVDTMQFSNTYLNALGGDFNTSESCVA